MSEGLQRQLDSLAHTARLVGMKEEQERIIKLLTDYFQPETAKGLYPADYEQYLDLIALIKGENK